MKTIAIIASMILLIVVFSGCIDETATLSNTSAKCAANTTCENDTVNIAPAGKELATHGDFESQESKECWKFFGGPTAQPSSSAIAHGGSRAMAITNKDSNESYWIQKSECLVPIVEGKSYELSGWIITEKADVGDIGGANLEIEFVDSVDAVKALKTKSTSSVKIAKDGAWTQVSAKEIAVAGSKFARVKLIISGTGTATFDDVKIVEQ